MKFSRLADHCRNHPAEQPTASDADHRPCGDRASRLLRQPNLQPLWQSLVKRVTADSNDVGALLDLSIIELIAGRRDNRLRFQAQALATQRLYRLAPAIETAKPLRLLAFMAPGDFMANTPVEFLLEGSSVQLDILYVSAGPTASTPSFPNMMSPLSRSPNRKRTGRFSKTCKRSPRPGRYRSSTRRASSNG